MRLGPECVGLRVVVRRVVPGVRGPSGGPAMTDVLGVLEQWDGDTLTVRPEDGEPVVIERRLLVSGKPVPPRPSPRLRVPVVEAEHRALASWPPVESQWLGDWVLRAAGGFSARANSALVVGDPGRPWDEALAHVRTWYADRRLPAWVQVVRGSAELDRLAAAGWVGARTGEADTGFHLASLSAVRRALRSARADGAARVDLVDLVDHVDHAWLASDDRAREHGDVARRVLEGPRRVRFAVQRGRGGDAVARARGAVTDDGDWVGVTDVWVSPGRRREGRGAAVLAALLGWAAEEGATTAYLQVREDNHAARALYERLGFVAHHAYRYLRPPGE